MATHLTRDQLRAHYKRIEDMISEERRMREAVLSFSPKLKAKLKACDDALDSLLWLGNALGALLPPDGPVIVQESLFEAKDRQKTP